MGWSSLDSLLPRFLSRTGKISFLYESEPKKRGRARKRAPSKTSFLPVVGDDDQGVDRLAERLDAVCGGAAAAAALEGEGVGDDADLLTILLFFWVRRKSGKGRERRIREESRRGVVAFSVFSWRVRVRPSRRWEQEKGFPSPPLPSLTPSFSHRTVRAPASFAALATAGAAPVPVPPPIPAVMKTRSAPATARATSAADSCAAAAPREGSPPVPRPRVSSAPSWSLLRQELDSRAWASVLTAQNSTPWICRDVFFLKGEVRRGGRGRVFFFLFEFRPSKEKTLVVIDRRVRCVLSLSLSSSSSPHLQARVDHAVDGVTAAAADTDDLDAGVAACSGWWRGGVVERERRE